MTIKNAEMLFRLKSTEIGGNDYGGPNFAPKMEYLLNFNVGTGVDQFDLQYFDERQVNASSNDDIDLAGVLAPAFGGTLTFAEIVLIAIINHPRAPGMAANLSSLTIGNAAAPWETWVAPATGRVGPIKPRGFLVLGSPDAAGLGAVGAGASDVLRVANGAGGTAYYQIAILGRST